jgi:hypothetical protein
MCIDVRDEDSFVYDTSISHLCEPSDFHFAHMILIAGALAAVRAARRQTRDRRGTV